MEDYNYVYRIDSDVPTLADALARVTHLKPRSSFVVSNTQMFKHTDLTAPVELAGPFLRLPNLGCTFCVT